MYFGKILDNENVCVHYYCNEVTEEDIEAMLSYIVENGITEKTNLSIYDIRDVKFPPRLDSYLGYARKLAKLTQPSKERFIGIYTSTPMQVVASHILQESMDNVPYRFKMFSSFHALVNWLGVENLTKERYEQVVAGLRENCPPV